MATATETKPKESTTREQRQASVFQIEIVDEPPTPTHGAPRGALYKLLEELMEEHPNAWARVAVCHSRSGANSIKSTIKAEKRRVPGSKNAWEFTARINNEANTSELYARYNA